MQPQNITDEKIKLHIIGGANIDHYGRMDSGVIKDEHSLLDQSFPGRMTRHAGGVGRNIAENLGRLGCRPRFIGSFGDDHDAEFIKAILDDTGVDYSPSLTTTNHNSDVYMAIHDADGYLVTAISQMDLVGKIDEGVLKRALGQPSPTDMIVFDGNLSVEAISYIFTRYSHARIMVDPASPSKAVKIKPHLRDITLLKCNRGEAAILTGLPDEVSTLSLVRALVEEGVENVLLSDGPSGFIVGNKDSHQHFTTEDSYKTEITNVSGAGDALMAGMIFGLYHDRDAMAAALIAERAAALTLGYDGPVHPEIHRTLLEQNIDEYAG
jgi:pseudouridine kinase